MDRHNVDLPQCLSRAGMGPPLSLPLSACLADLSLSSLSSAKLLLPLQMQGQYLRWELSSHARSVQDWPHM